MGKVKLILFVYILLASYSLLQLTSNSFLLSQMSNQTHIPKSVAASSMEKSILATSTTSANLTLIPQDKINVIPVVIIEIVDINTVKVLLDDGMEEVHLIGIKIPSDTSQSRYKKCYGETIESAIEKLALGKKAYMIDDTEYEKDIPQKYIFLEDLTFLNLELLKRGITSMDSTSNYLYKEEFAKVQETAQESSAGVWYDVCTISPTPTPQPSQTKVKPTTVTSNLYSRLISTPTIKPSPKPTLKPTSTPTPSPVASSQQMNLEQPSTNAKPSSLNPEILFLLINNHRKDIGKPSFEKNADLCQLAVLRGPELYDEIFVTHTVHSGLYNRNLPYWITENMAHYDSEEQIFNWWMGSTIHRKAIESDNKYSCGECYGNSCAQLFTSYIKK